jgi:outer membrane protein assembly factor BamE (lipoprotein component of BamABCDE complex)
MKSSLSFLCLFVFAGCVGNANQEPAPEDRLTVGKVQGEIKIGMSAASVVEVLGSPNIITTDEQRREVWVYDKVSTERMDASTSSYGTLLIVGGSSEQSRSSTRQRTLTIIIKYDEEKKVRVFAYNYTQF